MAKINEVAKKCGVSHMTVARVFSHPEKVKPTTREKVLQIARELNYQPNPSARALAQKSTHNILFLLSRSQQSALINPFYAPVVDALLHELNKHKLNLIVASSESITDIDGMKFLDQPLDGAIIAGDAELEIVKRFVARKTPLVIFNRSLSNYQLPTVLIRNRACTADLTKFLLAQGHRRICLLSGNFSKEVQEEREGGYKEVMKEEQLAEQTRIKRVDDDLTAVATVLEDDLQLTLAERPTAYLCTSDAIAVKAIKVLLRNKISVPTGVSVVGIDDSVLAKTIEPELTTMRIEPTEIARKLVKLLWQQLVSIYQLDEGSELNNFSTDEQVTLTQYVEGQLVVRDSATAVKG